MYQLDVHENGVRLKHQSTLFNKAVHYDIHPSTNELGCWLGAANWLELPSSIRWLNWAGRRPNRRRLSHCRFWSTTTDIANNMGNGIICGFWSCSSNTSCHSSVLPIDACDAWAAAFRCCSASCCIHAMNRLSRLSADTVKPKPVGKPAVWWRQVGDEREKLVSAWSKKQWAASPSTTPCSKFCNLHTTKLLNMKYLKNNNPICKATHKRTMNSVKLYTNCAKFYVHIKIELICLRTGLILSEISSHWVTPPQLEWSRVSPLRAHPPRKTNQCYHITADFYPL